MKTFRAISAFFLLQSYTLTTLAASLPPSLSISNTNTSSAPPVNPLHLPNGDYVLQVKSEGNVTIGGFIRDSDISVFHAYHLLRQFNTAEELAVNKVLQVGPGYHMGTSPLTWEERYQTTRLEFSTIAVALFPLEAMTYEHMEWAMKALGGWVGDKNVKGFRYTIKAEGVGLVGMDEVTRTDFGVIS